MVSLKKRLVVGITLLMLLTAMALPVGAEDNSTSSTPSPSNGISLISIQIGGLALNVTLSIPVRCGNNC